MIKIANNLKYMLAEKAPSNSDKPVKEELVGDQEKLDVNNNKRLDAEDFKMLRSNKSADMRANDVVNMNTFGGGLADYLAYSGPGLGVFGARRAARSSALGDSVGVDPGLLLNHPIKTRTAATLLGSLLGGGAGAAIGNYADPGRDGTAWGAGIGAGVGGLATFLGAGAITRNRMRAINEAVNDAKALKPIAEKGLGIGLYGGPQNLGRVEAEQAINSGGSKEKILRKLLDSANSQTAAGPLGVYGARLASAGLGAVVPGAGLLSMPIDIAHGVNHDLAARNLREEGARKRQNKGRKS